MNFLGDCFFLAFFPCLLAHRCLLLPQLQAVLCGQKESVTQFLSDHSSAHRAERGCFACPVLWPHLKGLRDSWRFLHHGISLQTLRASPWSFACPSCLWSLDWGSLSLPAFHPSPRHHATTGVDKPSSLFCSALQPPRHVPAFSVHLNATCHSP